MTTKHITTMYILYQNYNMSWDSFISEQSNNGVYATELFIKTTAVLLGMNIHITSVHCTPEHPYNMYKNSNLRKEVGIAIKSKETSSQFESVRNSYVAIMHQPVTICSTM